MCRRQRDAVLSRHPVGDAAKEDGEASLATLRKWALDVTTERLLILVLRNFAFDGLIDWDTFAYEPISERGCNDPTGCLVEALRAVAGDEAADDVAARKHPVIAMGNSRADQFLFNLWGGSRASVPVSVRE